MDISIFDVIGPIMIGPSSSHTAGAARLARVARLICGKPFFKVTFGLYGSFAKTGAGHGTDKALLAGAMGFFEDDEEIADAYLLAKQNNIKYEFYEAELNVEYENSCKITFYCDYGEKTVVIGSSIGGGRIVITSVNGVKMESYAEKPTLIVTQLDQKGVISSITQLLAWQGINVAVMRTTRASKGQLATSIIETDEIIPTTVKDLLLQVEGVKDLRILNFGLEER